MIEAIERIGDLIKSASDVELTGLPAEETTLLIIDIINGLAKTGSLASPK